MQLICFFFCSVVFTLPLSQDDCSGFVCYIRKIRLFKVDAHKVTISLERVKEGEKTQRYSISFTYIHILYTQRNGAAISMIFDQKFGARCVRGTQNISLDLIILSGVLSVSFIMFWRLTNDFGTLHRIALLYSEKTTTNKQKTNKITHTHTYCQRMFKVSRSSYVFGVVFVVLWFWYSFINSTKENRCENHNFINIHVPSEMCSCHTPAKLIKSKDFHGGISRRYDYPCLVIRI